MAIALREFSATRKVKRLRANGKGLALVAGQADVAAGGWTCCYIEAWAEVAGWKAGVAGVKAVTG